MKEQDAIFQNIYKEECWELAGAVMVVVGGENIKEDMFHRCIKGKVVEANKDMFSVELRKSSM